METNEIYLGLCADPCGGGRLGHKIGMFIMIYIIIVRPTRSEELLSLPGCGRAL